MVTADPDELPDSDSVLAVDDVEGLTMESLQLIDDMWDDDPLVENPGRELSAEVDEELRS